MPEEHNNPNHHNPNPENSDQSDEFQAQSPDLQPSGQPEQFDPSTPDLQPSDMQSDTAHGIDSSDRSTPTKSDSDIHESFVPSEGKYNYQLDYEPGIREDIRYLGARENEYYPNDTDSSTVWHRRHEHAAQNMSAIDVGMASRVDRDYLNTMEVLSKADEITNPEVIIQKADYLRAIAVAYQKLNSAGRNEELPDRFMAPDLYRRYEFETRPQHEFLIRAQLACIEGFKEAKENLNDINNKVKLRRYMNENFRADARYREGSDTSKGLEPLYSLSDGEEQWYQYRFNNLLVCYPLDEFKGGKHEELMSFRSIHDFLINPSEREREKKFIPLMEKVGADEAEIARYRQITLGGTLFTSKLDLISYGVHLCEEYFIPHVQSQLASAAEEFKKANEILGLTEATEKYHDSLMDREKDQLLSA